MNLRGSSVSDHSINGKEENENADRLPAAELSKHYEEVLKDCSFENAINAMPVYGISDTSSSEDDDSSLGDWREISKRLDSDFESETEEELPIFQSLPPKISRNSAARRRPSVSWQLLKSFPNATSTPRRLSQPNLRQQSTTKRSKAQARLQKAPAQKFVCTFANCTRSYANETGLKLHLAHHNGMSGSCLKRLMVKLLLSRHEKNLSLPGLLSALQ